MAIVKPILSTLLCLSLFTGCLGRASTVTIVTPVESDTFISNVSSLDHSDYPYLSLFRNAGLENRVLVKLPTGSNNSDNHLEQCISDPFCFLYFMPIFIIASIIAPGCDDSSLTAANLNWAYLEFNTEDGTSPADGTIQIQALNEPWWHNVTWERTHPFTNKGLWSTPGGTVNSALSFDNNCTNLQGGQTCSAGEVKFDMTDYFAFLIDNTGAGHFGLVLSFLADSPEIRFFSRQSGSSLAPALVANYNCVSSSEAQTSRYYLGTPLE
jgi:hypothetical protein